MVLPADLWPEIVDVRRALAILTAVVVAYCVARGCYNIWFHPLAKYSGPRIAAISDLWWAVASTSGRYPWIIEGLFDKYGDVVRIAPNELVFFSPQAAKDIYLAQDKGLERFVQVGYDALDTGDNGISGEPDPVKHRRIAKKLAPAFSTRNFRAKETVVHKHIDLFVDRMREFGGAAEGAEMRRWTDWLALDLSADLTLGKDVGQMRDMKDSILLSSTLKLNLFLTLSQVTRKFRLLSFLAYFFIPPSVWFAMPQLISMNSRDVAARIERRGGTEHLDYFETLVPSDQPAPTRKQELLHLENVAGQLLLASWQPLANQFYSVLFFVLKEKDRYAALVKEVRSAFSRYEDICTESVSALKYLNGCVHESLRLHQETVDGLPRVSPGAMIDGEWVPKGVTVQTSTFAASRSSRFFTDALRFRPERWLASDHPLFNPSYAHDDLKAAKPFSQGPRGCPGGAIAVAVIRLFIAKIFWEFDLKAVEGQSSLTFDGDFIFMTFWERPKFQVRFKTREDGARIEVFD